MLPCAAAGLAEAADFLELLADRKGGIKNRNREKAGERWDYEEIFFTEDMCAFSVFISGSYGPGFLAHYARPVSENAGI